MVVRNDDRRRIEPQRLLHHLARMHLGGVDRAVKHLHVVDQPMARIEKQDGKDFVLEASQLGAQVVLDRRWRTERCSALHLLVDDLARSFQNLVGIRRPIAPTAIAHHQRGIEREGELRHDRAPVARAELPGTVASTAQRKQSGVADGRQDASAHGARRP